jgi:two-component system, LytTR family, response regulator
MIRSIIVDDELKSRESLKILIQDFCENVSVEAMCQNVAEAVQKINEIRPDLIFLDIQLQRETGFDLLARFNEVNFEVIFTTAYSEYAIRAFKFSAIDYLLKPIDIEDLRAAVAKVQKRKSETISQRLDELIHNLKSGSRETYKVALPTTDGLVFVKLNDILYCEASSNYTEITMNDNKKYVVSRTLKEYDEMLSDQNFFRIHHSYLINLNGVSKYVRGEGGYVIMTNGKSLDVSKRKRDGFLQKIAGTSKGTF